MLNQDTSDGFTDQRRPGDELRDAQGALEVQIRDLFLAFGQSTGAWISAVHVEYLGNAGGSRQEPGDIVVRTTLET